jgi:BASS family bile acid:Na+ symporter
MVMPLLFAITMLAIGSLLSSREVRLVYQRWPTVLAGTAIQYSTMPLLAYALGRLLGLEGPILVGVVMVGCVPGAMASNVLTLIARGNVSYSVSLTTSATLLSPLLVPWILWLLLDRMVTDFPAVKVCVNLCWMVVIPVIAGYVLSHRFATWARGAQEFAAVVANLTILWIIAVVVGVNRDRLAEVDGRLITALLLINVGGYLCGNLGARAIRLPSGMRRALTLEVGMQNAGLGSTLALMLFKEPAVALAPAVYTFGCMLTGTFMARAWSRQNRPTDQSLDAPA